MPVTIYTLGYASWTLDQVADVVEEKDALLVDVRLKPFSRKPGFTKAELERRLRGRYEHVPELGNVAYKSGRIEIKDPAAGAEQVHQWMGQERGPIILMCGCKDYRRCHRKPVAELVAVGADEIKHLEPPVDAGAGHIKAITLHQPWASLIAAAAGHQLGFGKHYETRSWRTSYRGELAIHAAKTKKSLHLAKDSPFSEPLITLGYKTLADVPRGKVIAVAELADCLPTDELRFTDASYQAERNFGDFSPGRWAWKLENIRRLDEPVPVRGHQGLWNISRDLITPKD